MPQEAIFSSSGPSLLLGHTVVLLWVMRASRVGALPPKWFQLRVATPRAINSFPSFAAAAPLSSSHGDAPKDQWSCLRARHSANPLHQQHGRTLGFQKNGYAFAEANPLGAIMM
eukprot:8988684-Pyramimonas_sp.AAC.2